MPCTLTRATNASSKLYNRELCSTIPPYKNGENAYIYSKQKYNSENETLQLKHCVCMSSDSLRMQTLADRGPRTWCPFSQIQTAILCQTPP